MMDYFIAAISVAFTFYAVISLRKANHALMIAIKRYSRHDCDAIDADLRAMAEEYQQQVNKGRPALIPDPPFTDEEIDMLETIIGEIKEVQTTQKAMAEKQAALSAQMDELVNAVKSVTTTDLPPVLSKLEEIKATLGTAGEETDSAQTGSQQSTEGEQAA